MQPIALLGFIHPVHTPQFSCTKHPAHWWHLVFDTDCIWDVDALKGVELTGRTCPIGFDGLDLAFLAENALKMKIFGDKIENFWHF